ncbi:transposase [Arthrobacter sp. HS15c]|uniref:transposase n=1 Tax=Arthrobacter sp. HS15c TaxID=3230279 RepID=UPI00346548F2
MAVRRAAAVASWRAGRRDRPVSGLPQGPADVLPRTAVSVDAFQLVKLGKDILTEVRKRLSQQVHGRGDAPSTQSGPTADYSFEPEIHSRTGHGTGSTASSPQTTPPGSCRPPWLVKEQLRTLLSTGSLADAAMAKDRLQALVEHAAQPETNRLWRTVCRWWKEIEVLIFTGATTAKVEANDTEIKHIKRTVRGFTNARNYKTRILLRSAAKTTA